MAARLPRSPLERQSVLNRSMLGLSGGGRSAVVSPEPRPLAALPTAAVVVERVQYSQYGAVALTADADVARYTVREGGLIDELHGALGGAGSSSTVFTWYLNGSSIGTVTLASSDTDDTDSITPIVAVPGDRIHSRVTTAGTGATGASSDLEMKG